MNKEEKKKEAGRFIIGADELIKKNPKEDDKEVKEKN